MTKAQRAKVRHLFRRAKWNPLVWFVCVLRVSLRPWQERTLRKIRRQLRAGNRQLRVHIGASPAAGKTLLAAGLFLWVMLCHADAKGLTLAYDWDGVDRLTWAKVRALHSESILGEFGIGRVYAGEPKLMVDGKDWFGVGRSVDTSRPEKLRGDHSTTAAIRLVDEASSVPEAYLVHSQGLLVDSAFSLDIYISNVWDTSSWFYAVDVSDDPDLIRVKVTLRDLIDEGSLPESAWKQALLRFGGDENHPQFLALYMCVYMSGDPYSPVRPEKLDACMERAPELVGEKVVGIDLACSENQDETVITQAHGLDVLSFFGMQTRDHVLIANEAIRQARELGARVIAFDADGLGGPFASILRSQGWNPEEDETLEIREFRANEAPSEVGAQDFGNWYAEAAEAFVRSVNAVERSFPDDAKFRSQLLGIRFVPVAGGRVKVQKHKDGKKGGKSPDRFDSALIATCGKKPTTADASLADLEQVVETIRNKRPSVEEIEAKPRRFMRGRVR